MSDPVAGSVPCATLVVGIATVVVDDASGMVGAAVAVDAIANTLRPPAALTKFPEAVRFSINTEHHTEEHAQEGTLDVGRSESLRPMVNLV